MMNTMILFTVAIHTDKLNRQALCKVRSGVAGLPELYVRILLLSV